jgi:hypothetical protein
MKDLRKTILHLTSAGPKNFRPPSQSKLKAMQTETSSLNNEEQELTAALERCATTYASLQKTNRRLRHEVKLKHFKFGYDPPAPRSSRLL